jgi:hypothetical protein
VDLAPERDVPERRLAGVAPTHGADGSLRAIRVDAQSDLGMLGWEVEAGDDDVVGLGSPGHAAVGEDAGWREHDALDRGTHRCRAGRVEVLGSEQRQVAEQAALGAADGVEVAVRDAQRLQRPASDAGLPRE